WSSDVCSPDLRERLGRPRERIHGNLSQYTPVNLGITDHAAATDVGATSLELRLDEHERLPPRPRKGEHGRQRLPDADEGDVAGDSSGANGSSRIVRAFVRSSTVT